MTLRLVMPSIDAPLDQTVRPSARVADVAKSLGADPSQIRKMIRDGDLEAHRLGKCGIRVFLDSVVAWQARTRIKVQGKKAAELARLDPPKPPTRATQAAHRNAVASLAALGLVGASRR